MPVYEVGEVGSVCYIAAAYCEGPNLDVWRRNDGQGLTPNEAAWIVAALADAMHYAHARGVLHRDLKPSNVLLEPRPAGTLSDDASNWPIPFTPKITDFGLAKISDLAGDDTRAGAMLGTPAYMAPEQAEGRTAEIDSRSDVYGLGSILYDLLTGHPPFSGTSDADTVRRVLTDDAQFSREHAQHVPADLAAICLKCLEKQPAKRYPSAGELADDLRRFLAGEPTQARPLTSVRRLAKWTGRHPMTAALVAVSCLAALTILGDRECFLGGWRPRSTLPKRAVPSSRRPRRGGETPR